MKNILQATLFVLGKFILQNAKAQDTIINIPDTSFFAKLLLANNSTSIARDSLGNNISIDINNDVSIQQSEANRVFSLNIYNANISSLVGINSFVNLRVLDCGNNQLNNLDLSAVPNLFYLFCYNNQLTSLDLSAVPNLLRLKCSYNQLTSIYLKNVT